MVRSKGEAMIFSLRTALTAAAVVAALSASSAAAAPLSLFPFERPQAPQVSAYAPVETEDAAELPQRFKRQVVSYPTQEAPGTVVVDTPNTYLYLVLGGGRAIRYGI